MTPAAISCLLAQTALIAAAASAATDGRAPARWQAPPVGALSASGALALDDPVGEGKSALGSGWQYPWYDPATDDIRRVKVRTPWEFPEFNRRWPSFRLDWVQWLMWGLILLGLALLTWLLIRMYLQRENRRATHAANGELDDIDDNERIEALPFRVERQKLSLLEEASRHYQAGDYSKAIVYLFSHQLVQLDRRQFIRLAKGKTNRQYLREIAAAPAVRGILEQTMVAFEDVFFGDRALGRARFEACWNRIGEFDLLTGRGAV